MGVMPCSLPQLQVHWWPRVLWCAAAMSPDLFGWLLELRDVGAEIELVGPVAQRLKLAQGTLPADTWARAKREWLAPYRDVLVQVMQHAAQGGVPCRWHALDGEQVLITADASWVQRDPVGSAVYTLSELAALLACPPDEIRTRHARKLTQSEK